MVGIKKRAMEKVVYSENAGEKKEMCADCFSLNHLKRDPERSGPVIVYTVLDSLVYSCIVLYNSVVQYRII